MSTETGREVIGANEHGEVTIITMATANHDKSGPVTVVGSKDVFVLREGGRTILETEDHAVALATANTLVGKTPEPTAATRSSGRGKAKAEEPEPEAAEV